MANPSVTLFIGSPFLTDVVQYNLQVFFRQWPALFCRGGKARECSACQIVGRLQSPYRRAWKPDRSADSRKRYD